MLSLRDLARTIIDHFKNSNIVREHGLSVEGLYMSSKNIRRRKSYESFAQSLLSPNKRSRRRITSEDFQGANFIAQEFRNMKTSVALKSDFTLKIKDA